MINSVIIDDEIHGQKFLNGLIAKHCPEVTVLAMADSMETGIAIIKKHKPDLVFLDIQMPNGTGFDLLDKIEKIDFSIIFTTAFDSYAIKAFKVSALDYLLKPIDQDDLQVAVNKMIDKKKLSAPIFDPRIEVLLDLQRQKQEQRQITNLSLPTQNGFEFVFVEDIVRLESDGNYTNVIFKTGEEKVVTRSLKEFEDILENSNFVRCHHSHMVNVKYVSRYIRGEGGILELLDGTQIDVSRRKKEEVLQKLKIL